MKAIQNNYYMECFCCYYKVYCKSTAPLIIYCPYCNVTLIIPHSQFNKKVKL